jgi:glutaredoxin 3
MYNNRGDNPFHFSIPGHKLRQEGAHRGDCVLKMRFAGFLLVLVAADAIRLGSVVPCSRGVLRCRVPVMEDVSEMPVSLESLSEIQQMVAGQAVVVYSKSRCADSMQCKSILDSMEQPYTTIDLDLRDNGEAIEAALLSLTQRSVPNVFVGGQLLLTRNSP